MNLKYSLQYRIERMFKGERGFVLRTDPVLIYWKMNQLLGDEDGKPADVVTFRNPLGEVRQALTPLRKVGHRREDGTIRDRLVYNKYLPGQQFP